MNSRFSLMSGWYTDTVDVYRSEAITGDDFITRNSYVLKKSRIPCRVIRHSKRYLQNTQTASEIHDAEILSCDVNTDIQEGDRLLITRGGFLGRNKKVEIYFAGAYMPFYDPLANVTTGLEHMEVPISRRRVNSTTPNFEKEGE